jgi:hypothetical protein
MATGPPARRAPSGLPLRKSQSAVELGSWRSFSAGEELLDMMLAAGGEAGQVRVGSAQRAGEPLHAESCSRGGHGVHLVSSVQPVCQPRH